MKHHTEMSLNDERVLEEKHYKGFGEAMIDTYVSLLAEGYANKRA